jgi:hypothetical protein
VNLGNVAPASVLALETLRLGLRADTVPARAEGSAALGQGALGQGALGSAALAPGAVT